MTKIKIHNPTNEYTKNNRYYNYFFDVFTEYLKSFFEVEENRDFPDAHKERQKIYLQKGVSNDLWMMECEYIIENMDTGEFVILSVSDDLSHCILNEQSNPYLKKVLVSQFIPTKMSSHIGKNLYKYSPWIYFQAIVIDLEPFYQKRTRELPTEDKLYFKGTSLDDRLILNHINKDIITTFNPISYNLYFDEIIKHKIALSVDGRGEFCYRDIECFAIGVPIIRFEYDSVMYDPLIPNYHYISIPRPPDMKLYRLGNQFHAELLMERYKEVLNDTEFLNYISRNARKYYEKNCLMHNATKNTYKLLNLDTWL
jgi:hypothetical protein